ncbi:MAG: DUF4886 domain-containing protein [Ruminococcaceae bacterium]|nr:DUF4886 domain-containing protein [Oscillospiraceae bacterium]
MNILSIGNSFSLDAQRYVHQIARADGVELDAINLYIGGCSLSTHFRNMLSGAREYGLQVNGHISGFKVSLQEGLLSRDWDVVTLQQASPNSFDYESYQPYLNELADYVRACVPKAKIFMHQTWAYDKESTRFQNILLGETPDTMLAMIKEAYKKAAKEIGADGIIPGGEVLMMLLQNGIEKVHRDNHHASMGIGRYALGLTWYKVLTGNSVTENSFSDFDEPISAEEIAIAKKCVMECLG